MGGRDGGSLVKHVKLKAQSAKECGNSNIIMKRQASSIKGNGGVYHEWQAEKELSARSAGEQQHVNMAGGRTCRDVEEAEMYVHTADRRWKSQRLWKTVYVSIADRRVDARSAEEAVYVRHGRQRSTGSAEAYLCEHGAEEPSKECDGGSSLCKQRRRQKGRCWKCLSTWWRLLP
jgi:hypothetical protein